MPPDPVRVARAASARRRVKRAAGLLREAASDLAASSEGADTIGVVHAVDARTVTEAQDLVRVAQARHGRVDVVILARPDDG